MDNPSFAGMTLTDIFQVQSLQSLFIKFWYLALTSESIISPEDANICKAIRKTLSFANCFSYELPLRTYISFIDKILQALASIQPKKTFDILLGHLRNNKVNTVSFQLFGVAFLQLFGRILELLNAQTMNKILRKIFMQITAINKIGISTLKTKPIKQISFEQLIPNFKQLLITQTPQKSPTNPQQQSIDFNQDYHNSTLDRKTIKGRLQLQHNLNYDQRQTMGEHYPIGQKMKVKDKSNISCFVMGGFQIVDYSQSINQLHRKLLTKILLNK